MTIGWRTLNRTLLTTASPTVEESSHPIETLAVPLIGCLLQTGGIVWFVGRTPGNTSLTWPRLLATALFFLLVTTVAHLFAIWSNRRIFRDQIDAPANLLIFAIWPSAVWIPLLVLLIRENSIWMAFIPSLIAATAATSLKSWSNTTGTYTTSRNPGTISTLFHPQHPPPLLRVITPAIVTSIALQAALTELLLRRFLTAGSLLAICTVLPIWTYPIKLRSIRADQSTLSSIRATLPRTLTVLLLIAIALIPYLRSSRLSAPVSALLQTNVAAPSTSSARDVGIRPAPSNSYSGVILLLPSKPHHEIVAPAPSTTVQFSSLRKKPVIIPFDGDYWYFKQPDLRPKADAPVVRGDPTKKNIHSTDTRPLSMEAHQRLDTPIRLDCCRAIRLAIQNADNRPGAISIELLLKDRSTKDAPMQSLGTLVLPSSEDPHMVLTRPPVDETLTFALPRRTRSHQFDEITVAIKPAKERARAGAHIAIQYFELLR